MKNILIINGHQKYPVVAEGKLTQFYIDVANDFFIENGFCVKNSVVESSYDIADEVAKFAWADIILFQYPVYWMGVPWLTKKYIDEIFSVGQGTVTYENDGRTRNDPSKKYGSGGLMQGKHYMLSLTYNCPTTEFSNKEGFFDGLTLDESNVAVHKTFQFCGASPLATFSVHDIFKGDLDLEVEKKRFQEHLTNVCENL
jgi:modulator of drug activity B